jgi:hypothetical protein
VNRFIAASLLVLLLFTPNSSVRSSQTGDCGNFFHYSNARIAEIDSNPWLNEREKGLSKIDRLITLDELLQVSRCMHRSLDRKIKEFFGGLDYVVDPDLYQFAFSDFSYGQVVVDAKAYPAYLKEKNISNAKIFKVTFDFDEESNAVVRDVFSVAIVNGKAQYKELMDGQFVDTDRCLACHDTADRAGLFFKSRFTGLRPK